jgi:transposase
MQKIADYINDHYPSVDEAAKALNVTRQTVYNWIRQGDLFVLDGVVYKRVRGLL